MAKSRQKFLTTYQKIFASKTAFDPAESGLLKEKLSKCASNRFLYQEANIPTHISKFMPSQNVNCCVNMTFERSNLTNDFKSFSETMIQLQHQKESEWSMQSH